MDKEILDQIDLGVEQEVAEAHLFARESSLPERKDLAKYVFK